ncbi:MAG: hypothetical protein ACYTBJ_19225 [Planctomycetota bacterium]|jgi:hypothetical protein
MAFSVNVFQNHMRIKANRYKPAVMYYGYDYAVMEFQTERDVVEALCDFESHAANYGYKIFGHQTFLTCINRGE